jgi:hypothetical protein
MPVWACLGLFGLAPFIIPKKIGSLQRKAFAGILLSVDYDSQIILGYGEQYLCGAAKRTHP